MKQSRHIRANLAIDTLIADTGWSRDIPFGELAATFPLRGNDGHLLVTPAAESDRGRGAPVVDLYHPAMPIRGGSGMTRPALVSAKVSGEERLPRNAPLTTGTGDHLDGVIGGLVSGTGTPVDLVMINFGMNGAETLVVEDLGFWLARYAPVEATGARGNVFTVSKKSQRSKAGRVYHYNTLRLNLGPAIEAGLTRGWSPGASLPVNVG